MKTNVNDKGEGKFLKSEKTLKEFINISESKDFVISNNCDAKQMIVKSHMDRGFSNILFICGNKSYKQCAKINNILP